MDLAIPWSSDLQVDVVGYLHTTNTTTSYEYEYDYAQDTSYAAVSQMCPIYNIQ